MASIQFFHSRDEPPPFGTAQVAEARASEAGQHQPGLLRIVQLDAARFGPVQCRAERDGAPRIELGQAPGLRLTKPHVLGQFLDRGRAATGPGHGAEQEGRPGIQSVEDGFALHEGRNGSVLVRKPHAPLWPPPPYLTATGDRSAPGLSV